MTSRTCPTFTISRTCPNVSRTCPNVSRTCPNVSRTCPNVSRTCPNVSRTCPNVSRTCPNVSRTCPNVSRTCPYVGRICPMTNRISPMTSRKQDKLNSQRNCIYTNVYLLLQFSLTQEIVQGHLHDCKCPQRNNHSSYSIVKQNWNFIDNIPKCFLCLHHIEITFSTLCRHNN